MEHLEKLKRSGLLAASTDESLLLKHLNSNGSFYLGFDPTADSLHVGHLVALSAARWILQNTSLEGVILIGQSATARIGDPTGRVSSRPILLPSEIEANAVKLQNQISSLLPNDATVSFVDNQGTEVQIVDFVTQFLTHFKVNEMIHRDQFEKRLAGGQSLTLMEFVYPVFQAVDWLLLHDKYDCVVQLCGQDQWANALSGADLIHHIKHEDVSIMCCPLLTDSNNNKFGKTTNGAIWLDPQKTSPFDFFQFWRNVSDEDVWKLRRILTDLTDEEKPINMAKEELAFEVTKWVHGQEIALQCLDTARQIFASKTTVDMAALEALEATQSPLTELMVEWGLATSKAQARNLIKGKGVRINQRVVEDIELVWSEEEAVLSVGKKHHWKVRMK